MKKIEFLYLFTSAFTFANVTIIITPRGKIVNGITAYKNSYDKKYAKFVTDCQYYKVTKTWERGHETSAHLENGHRQKIKGRHIPYMKKGEYCHIPKEEL